MRAARRLAIEIIIYEKKLKLSFEPATSEIKI